MLLFADSSVPDCKFFEIIFQCYLYSGTMQRSLMCTTAEACCSLSPVSN